MISPCVAYLAGRTRIPYAPCCGAVLVLNRTTPAASDRAALCGCLKSITLARPSTSRASPTCPVPADSTSTSPSLLPSIAKGRALASKWLPSA
ncbi:hypothetical protein HPP92_000600 [Vanilla planifolia]|uniref:Uncharacterized protein n=1 Tax=Vanilla planifolia TaxID=51239 RepID=A0A835VCR9_VANPL|nr:hypothetical protein HPP92_000600 [Vanilla planifolia]